MQQPSLHFLKNCRTSEVLLQIGVRGTGSFLVPQEQAKELFELMRWAGGPHGINLSRFRLLAHDPPHNWPAHQES